MRPYEGSKPDRLSEPAEKKPDTSSDFSGPHRLRTLNVKLVAIIAGVIVLLVAAGAGAMLYMYSRQGQSKGDYTKVAAPKAQDLEARGSNGPTDEDKRQMQDVLSDSCQVKTVTDKDMTFSCGDHDIGPLTTADDVLYTSGINSLPVERKDIKDGQKAKIVYDSGKHTLSAVWIDYDK